MIRKTVITLTILHPDDETPEGASLGYIAHEIDEGGWLGSQAITTSEIVKSEMLRSECLALGNDGTFFDGADYDDNGNLRAGVDH